MKRWALWIGWSIGGALYQAAKPLGGLSPNWETHFDMMYWTGFTLLTLWLIERFEVQR